MKYKSGLYKMAFLVFLFSCDFKSKPYLKHDLEFEKLAGDCSQQNTQVNVDANTIGERYVFQECLESSFNGDYAVERNGDTVEVKFGKVSDARALYKITLDINTRPTYHFLNINGNTIPVTVTRD
jgi:hypothetical protein